MPDLEVLQALPDHPKPTPILLIHGAWHGAWCWAETFLPYFKDQGYATYALSLRGHGQSAGKPRFARTRDYLADIRTVAEQISREHGSHPVLIGHSMGGYLTQKYLETYVAPAAVLLASLPSRGSLPFFLRYARKHPATLLQVSLTMTPYHFVATPERAKELFFSPDFPDETLRQIHPLLGNESIVVSMESASVAVPRPRKVTAKHIPLLVLGAEHDAIFPPSEVKATARAYGVEATLYPHMAHNMMAEKGWEAVAGQIRAWLGRILL